MNRKILIDELQHQRDKIEERKHLFIKRKHRADIRQQAVDNIERLNEEAETHLKSHQDEKQAIVDQIACSKTELSKIGCRTRSNNN
jgi:hypothetical protein